MSAGRGQGTCSNVGHGDAAQLTPVPNIEVFQPVDSGPGQEAETWGKHCVIRLILSPKNTQIVLSSGYRVAETLDEKAHLLLGKIWTGKIARVGLCIS